MEYLGGFLGCNSIIKAALGPCYELVRRPLFFGLDGVTGENCLGTVRINLDLIGLDKVMS